MVAALKLITIKDLGEQTKARELSREGGDKTSQDNVRKNVDGLKALAPAK